MKVAYFAKVFFMGITILGRGILFVKFGLRRALKVEIRPSDLPPRYVLTPLRQLLANLPVSKNSGQTFKIH